MTERDLDQVLEIEENSFPRPWKREHFLFEIKNRPDSLVRVATQEERVLGYSVTRFIPERIAHIFNIAVRPDSRRRGIGSKLLEDIVEEASSRKMKEIYLEVRSRNEAAKKLYQNWGFELLFCVRGYYGNDDALVFLKNL